MIITQPYLLTVLGETKLFAQHSCVRSSPEVIAHITPHSIVAHLNTALVDMWPINQLRISISTACERNNSVPLMLIMSLQLFYSTCFSQWEGGGRW